jgi:hypothetical protein
MARDRFCNKDLPCDPHRRYASAAMPSHLHHFIANRPHTLSPQRASKVNLQQKT